MDSKPTGIGLDVGGANLKAAHSDRTALSRPFELWRRPAELAGELGALLAGLPRADRFAVTMTGELCDCFETKREGVNAILDAVEAVLPVDTTRVWSTSGHLLSLHAARQRPIDVAAGNWHALATYAGRFAPTGPAVLIDVGSTTTDLIPLRDGVPCPRGRTDERRLESNELVYTGVRRTPICALLAGAVMAEWFATSLDAHLVCGHVAEEPENCQTADGRPATRRHAHYRLARMVGGDGDTTTVERTRELAERAVARQTRLIADGLLVALSELPSGPRTVLLSGSGEFLGRMSWAEYVTRSGLESADVEMVSLRERLGEEVSTAACAYALAVLATER